MENPNRLRQRSRHPHQGHEEKPLPTLRDQAIGPGDVEKAQGPGAGRAAWRTPDDGGPACPCSSFGAGCYQPCHVLHLIPARLADCGQGATVAAVIGRATWTVRRSMQNRPRRRSSPFADGSSAQSLPRCRIMPERPGFITSERLEGNKMENCPGYYSTKLFLLYTVIAYL